MGRERAQINVDSRLRSNSRDDVVWSNQDPDDVPLVGPKKKRRAQPSCAANIVAFGVPFVAVAIFMLAYYSPFPRTEPPVSTNASQTRTNDEVATPSSTNELTSDEIVAKSEENQDVETTVPLVAENVVEPDASSLEEEFLVNDANETLAATEDPSDDEETLDANDETTNTDDAIVATSDNEPTKTEDDGEPISEKNDATALTEVSSPTLTTEIDVRPFTEEVVDETDDFFAKDEETPQPIYADPEETEQALAQFEFQLKELKKRDVRELDFVLEQLESLLVDARATLERAEPSLLDRTSSVVEEIERFRDLLDSEREFFRQLETFDRASLNSEETASFFKDFASTSSEADDSPEIADYRRDFAAATKLLQAYNYVDAWNAFVEREGEALERFSVTKEAVEDALAFLERYGTEASFLPEVAALKRRKVEWEFKLNNEVDVRRKIALRLESELSNKYWTYSPSADRWYYLPSPPKSGSNVYIASAKGETRRVEIPENAKEIGNAESAQTTFLRELSEKARMIPDSLQTSDAAKWYADWCEFLTTIQRADRLDPILQYVLFRDCARLLSQSDYFFSRRLEPLLRMLNAPQFENRVEIDRFQTDEPSLRALRQLASSRMSFLPKDHLTVDKTTAQLDEQVERTAFAYRRVGWLDRNFAGDWKCRFPSETERPVGDLYVVLPGDESSLHWRLYKIGTSDGKQIALNVATVNVPRGSIVFCRFSLTQTKQVSRRASVAKFFN